MGIFEDYARKYYELGLSIIPLNGKKPLLNNWSIYSQQLPNDNDFSKWELEYKNANIGLVCGTASNIIAFDFDYEGPDQEKIENLLSELLPPSPIRKQGQKKWTAFYKYNGQESFSLNRKSFRMIDFISNGKQTVLPPSIHPVTKGAYKWLGEDDLLNISIEDLPIIPDNILEKIKLLATLDFSSKENVFGEVGGRHDFICGYGWKIIETVNDINELAEKLLEYDLKRFSDKPYFSDIKYFNGQTPLEAAISVAKRIEKTVIRKKESRGQSWDITKNKDQNGFYLLKEITDEVTGEIKIVATPQFQKMATFYKESSELVCAGAGDYIYKDGYWRYIEDLEINNIITEVNKLHIKPAHIDSFKKMIRSYCFIGSKIFKPIDRKINLLNGIFDLNEMSLVEHSKEYFFKYKMPIEYKSDAECKKWLEFLNFVFENNDELILAAQKIFGYCLIGGDPFLHRAFVLYGEGRNGKSTFINVLRNILGKDSVSAVSMANLNRPFSVVRMDGKLANIVEETPSDEINSEIFKNIVGGGSVTAAYKGKDEFDMQAKCRMVFACNEMPIFKDKNESMLDRLFMIPFEVYIPEDQRDTEINQKLEAEYSGILNWAIQGARMILADRKIESPTASKKLKDRYRSETDTVYSWFNSFVTFDNPEPITTKDLYDFYAFDVKEAGQYPVSKDKFSKRIRKIIAANPKFTRQQDRFYDDNNVQHRGYTMLKYTGDARSRLSKLLGRWPI